VFINCLTKDGLNGNDYLKMKTQSRNYLGQISKKLIHFYSMDHSLQAENKTKQNKKTAVLG
jgi:hypothetical protein